MSATVVQAHVAHVSTSIGLGDLLFAHAHSSWHHKEHLLSFRFKNGNIEMTAEVFADLVTKGDAAISAARDDFDYSGSRAHIEDTA